MTIADRIRIIDKALNNGLFISVLIISDSPLCEIIPNRADISCNTMVAIIDKTIAQSNAYPKLTPAIVHKVTVPGPIKAAATNGPGPIFLNQDLIIMN